MDTLNSEEGMDSQSNAVKGAGLLLVIGEPFTEEHKKLIVTELSQGFRCWDKEASGIDINDELAQIANRADLGEEGPDGERIIRHCSENLVAEILVNPQTQTVTNAVKNFLSSPTKHKHLIYAGHAFKGSGAWILQDNTYTFNNFAHAFKDQDVGNALRKQEGGTLYIFTGAEGDWTNGHIAKNEISKLLDIKVNPTEKLDSIHGILQFTAYLSNFIRVRQLNDLLQSSDVVGSIRFSRPTLYIFPGCQGDSALFGISGFNLLVNGGYSRKACFWDFTRHLDRIDAALMTHLGYDNLYGFGSVLERKSIENVHPEIGFMYVNTSDKIKALSSTSPDDDGEINLHVNLAKEGNKLIQYAKQIGQIPQPCSRLQSGQTVEPINLYHKVGIGSLDMYILNPITDSKELKDFYQQWNQNVSQFGLNQHMPIQNTLSVCALLVWRPSDPNDNITRIFFPGNAPQHKVLEGLEKLKTLDILKHPQCTKASLTAKPAAKKTAGISSRPAPKAKISPVSTPRGETPKKEDTPKKENTITRTTAMKTKAAPPSTQKAKKEKEDVNKKTMKAPEKPKTEKTDKPKKTPTTPRSSAKSSTSSTPKEVSSPTKEPAKKKKESPKKEAPAGIPAKQAPVPDVLDTAPVVDPFAEQVINGGQESSMNPPSLMPEPIQPVSEPAVQQQPESLIDISPQTVPEPHPVQTEQEQFQGGAMDREKMLELGIYDEDHDIEQDLNAQQPEPDRDQRAPQMYGGMADSMHEDLMGDDDSSDNKDLMQGSYHGDLMSGSMHEAMFDNQKPFDSPMFQNGGSTIDELMTPEDDTSEEIQPQALPEPVAYAPESYGQGPDVIPNITGKDDSQMIEEQQVTPTAVEPDLLSSKQDETPEYEEESTVPVDEKVEQPQMLQTPDEVENNLPEDVREKDLSEETEKNVMDEHETTKEIAEEAEAPCTQQVEAEPVPFEQFEDLQRQDAVMDRVDVQDEMFPETVDRKEVMPEAHDKDDLMTERQDEDDMVPEKQDEDDLMPEKQDEVEPIPEKQDVDEVMPETQNKDVMHPSATDELEHQMLGGRLSPEMMPRLSPEMMPQSELVQDSLAEPEAEENDTVEEPDLMASEQDNDDRISPDLQGETPSQEELELDTGLVDSQEVPDVIQRPVSPEPNEQEQDEILTEEVEQVAESIPATQLSPTLMQDMENSDEERPDSPDSQVGAQDLARDSLERDIEEPENVEGELRDSIEKSLSPVEQTQEVEDDLNRDSIERSPSPVEQLQTNQPVTEETRDSMERSLSPVSQPETNQEDDTNRDSVERSASSEDQRESADRSEGESDETEEDDDDDESSSFEQDEATDEKCLIPDSLNEGLKPSEVGLRAGHTDSLAEQGSDNLLSPESEYTDPSQGQMGYHEIDDQDGDSVEGLDEKDSFAPPPPQVQDCGFDHLGSAAFGSGPMAAPFDQPSEPQSNNPFVGYEYQPDSSNQGDQPAGFNPLAEWGEPMGLPSPAPPGEKNETAATKKTSPKSKPATKAAADPKKTDVKKTETKRPTSARPASATKPPAAPASNGATKSRPSLGGNNASKPAGGANLNSSRLSTGGKAATAGKPRPGSAPAKDTTDSKPRANGTKRPATTTGTRSSPVTTKMPPLPPFNTYYIDLTYIPNHGDPGYSDIEFFKRVRARYYVLSALSPDTHVLDALIEGKKTWDDKSLAVTVIPTYDNETLRLWMSLHKDKLAENKIEIAPSASRCTIQLQDHETSSSAYRLEF